VVNRRHPNYSLHLGSKLTTPIGSAGGR